MSIKKTHLWKFAGKVRRKIKWLVQMHCVKYDSIPEEHLKHFGNDFPDKIFYVIRKQGYGSGLFSHFHSVFEHTIYALSKGYIPVVNMENYKVFCNEKKPVYIGEKKTSNAWEYYFEQPCEYSLKDIKNAKNVILSSMGFYNPDRVYSSDPYAGILYFDSFEGHEKISKYYEFVSQYLKFNSKTIVHVEKEKEKLFGNKKNILGCFHRGAGYNASYIKNHPIMPSLEQTLEKTQDIFQLEKFDCIFVCSEEHETVEAFCKMFPREKIIFIERERLRNYNEQQGLDILVTSKTSSGLFKNALDYLTEMYLLSQCDGIIASKAGGALFAMGYNNNKYRYTYKWDLGLRT